MKRLPIPRIVTMAFAFALPATPAVADLLVTEVVGSVRTLAEPSRMQTRVNTLDQIANGSELSLASGAKSVVVDLANGNEYELLGEERYLVTPAGPKSSKGTIATAKPLPEKSLPAVRISGRKASQATVIMRDAGKPNGLLHLLQEEALPTTRDNAGTITQDSGILSVQSPLPDETLIERPLLRWSRQQDATRYRVSITSSDGSDKWETLTQSLETSIPETLPLKTGAHYRWRVEALAGEQLLNSLEEHFSMASVEVQAMLARLKPAPDAPFARRVLYAAQVEQAGARSLAQSLWKTLASERQNDPVLRSRAVEPDLPLP